MFIRKKTNRSGTTSVVVVDKSRNRFRELKCIGVSSDANQIAEFEKIGLQWIKDNMGSAELDLFEEQDKREKSRLAAINFLNNIDSVLINGTQLIISKAFDSIGFNIVKDNIFKSLVIARLCEPSSKAATADYLRSYYDEDLKLHNIYRYLDKLQSSQQDIIQQVSVAHTRKILGDHMGVVFYDVTTLYFETDNEVDLKNNGFSKDGKHSNPQIVLGLLVSMGGYPLSYSIFKGNQYEGYTMIPIIDDFVRRFNLNDFVVVADSGLINTKNILLLEQAGYKYIIGNRIKNETDPVKRWILAQEKVDKQLWEYPKQAGQRLILSYTDKRARKDAYNRKKGIARLEKSYRTGVVNKENINKRGYNKFLELTRDVGVSINYEKIKDDQRWDGLKGYVTNTDLPAQLVYEQYQGLWQIEQSFRIAKSTLEIRPVFLFNEKRIEAHICICFVALKVYREIDRRLQKSGIKLSADKVIKIAKTITTIKVHLPDIDESITKTLLLTPKQRSIAMLLNNDFWKD
jgi:transposase